MNVRLVMLCLCLLAAAAIIFGAAAAKAPSGAPALKSHHLCNLSEEVSEGELIAAFQEINRVISNLGHPDAGYRLWKVTGEQSGDYGFLWEGVWPDQATYDAIHDEDDYKEVVQRFMPMFETLTKNEVYNRFVEIPTN